MAKKERVIADDSCVIAWLRESDIELYMSGRSLPSAAAVFFSQKRLRVSPRRLGELRKESCDFWGKEKRVAFTRVDSLREEEWDAIRRWAGMNANILKVAPCIEFVARIMRSSGIAASPTLLTNSTSFMEKWNEVRS